MSNKSIKHWGILIAAVLLAASFASAQAGRGVGRIGGTVTDLEGNPIEGAKVSISYPQNESLKYEYLTNKKGEWSFIGLGSGNWNLISYAKGFDPINQPVYVSQLSVNPPIKIKLKKAEKPGGGFIEDEASFAFLENGNKFYREGKYDEAIVQYETFIAKNPLAYQVRISIADCHLQKGDFEKATTIYNDIIEKAKTDAALGADMLGKALAGLGNIMLKQNKLPEAQEYFKESIAASPKDEVLAYNVGEIFFSNQGYDEAIKYFSLASEIKPDWPDSFLKLGYVYLNKADTANAVVKFEKFLTLEPDGERAALVRNILTAIKK
ncbi:MAG: tetratricopeptide repeat protein [Acidobacteriota bacterium]|nr:tetratricopeptide repeat protein [Acidobacteriota bacterium]